MSFVRCFASLVSACPIWPSSVSFFAAIHGRDLCRHVRILRRDVPGAHAPVGQVNHLGDRYKGVINGIYIAAYYFGGALGSWLPTKLYRRAGWIPFLAALGAVVAIAALSLQIALRQADQPRIP